MEGVTVRPERSSDIQGIAVVNVSAFEGEDEARLVTELRQSSGFIPELSLVAECNNRIVGHLLLTRAVLRQDVGEREVLVLGPMSVAPSQAHRGIGSELVEAAIARARELDFDAIVVVGPPDFYKRLGFQLVDKWGLQCSLSAPTDAVMAMELKPGGLAGGGLVVYPPLFSSSFEHRAASIAVSVADR